MELPPAQLEDWLRDYYFTAEVNICSSGVEPYSLGELRRLTGVTQDELDRLVFDDGYSYGAPAVRQAIAERWGDGDPTKVMTTCGSNEALALVLGALLRPDDEVVVVEPGYHSLIHLAVAQGCRVRRWRLDAGHGFEATVADGLALVTPGTRAIIVNFPHNPTGVTIEQDDMDALVARAEQVGAYVLWDGAFTDMCHGAAPLRDPTTLYERAVSVGTMSKSYGLPGLRFGWCIAPPELLAECVRLRDYTTLHVPPLVEALALHAIEHLDALLLPRRERAGVNREVLRHWADEQPGVTLTVPAGGVAAFPRLGTVDDVDAFCEFLLSKYGVLVVPGSCFDRPQHIRVGFGGPTDELVDGLGRLSAALGALAAA